MTRRSWPGEEGPSRRMPFSAFPIWLAGALASCVVPAGPLTPWQERDAPPPSPKLAMYGRQLNFGAGMRAFEDEGFGALNDQFALTLDYCEPIDLGALRLEGGMHYSYDESTGTSGGQTVGLRGRTFELSVGLNVSQLIGRLRPYFGFGASLLFLHQHGIDEQDGLVFEDEDLTAGGYVKAGLLFQVTRTSHLGVELRHFEGGDVVLDGADLATGYDQLLFLFGTSFE